MHAGMLDGSRSEQRRTARGKELDLLAWNQAAIRRPWGESDAISLPPHRGLSLILVLHLKG